MKPMHKLWVALMIPVLFAAAAEWAFRSSEWPETFDKERFYRLKAKEVERLKEPPEVVFLGDSRVFHGVNSPHFAQVYKEQTGESVRVFNFGLPGAPPLVHYAWSGRILRELGPPKWAVLMVSPYMFSDQIGPGAYEALSSLYRPEDAIRGVWDGLTTEQAAQAFLNSTLDLMRHRGRVVERVREPQEFKLKPLAYRSVMGWVPSGRASASVQRRRAYGRAKGYEKELKHPAKLNEQQFELLEATIERFKGAGTRVIVMTTPSSSPLWRNDNPKTLYPEIMKELDRRAKAHGVPFVRHREVMPDLPDTAFADGDHLNPAGSRRYTSALVLDVMLPLMFPDKPRATKRWGPVKPTKNQCEVLFDFEDRSDPQGWRGTGTAFKKGGVFVQGAQGAQQDFKTFGIGVINTFTASLGDRAQGTLTSPQFELRGKVMRLRVAGGKGKGLGVELRVGGEVIRRARGRNQKEFHLVEWSLPPEVQGKVATLRVEDQATGAWGHLVIDQVERCP